MILSESLLEDLRKGRVVLFLGAGASVGALKPDGTKPPLGPELAGMLAKRFLGEKFSDRSLDRVSELAISQSDLVTVQGFIRDVFTDLSPAKFHNLVPTFRWRAIFTTNFDRVIEDAYEQTEARVQAIRPMHSNLQKIDDYTRSPDDVLLYKLHGCVTRIDDPSLPLILTPDQYTSARAGRSRLFESFVSLAHECPVVFIGHELYDSDIRTVLAEVDRAGAARPRFYLVRPHLDEIERTFWEGRRVTTLDGTFESFMQAVDKAVPATLRPVLSLANYEHPIQSHFSTGADLSREVALFLQNEVTFVHGSMPIDRGSAKQFYRGFDLGWYPIQESLDVRRRITDDLLSDVVLVDESDRPSESDFYVVLAEAGAGKTTLMRRVALEASTDWNAVCLFLHEYGRVDLEALHEIVRLTNDRVFLFADNAADRVGELIELARYCRRHRLRVTIVAAERTNEWNVTCKVLEEYVSDFYRVRYLSRPEIVDLVERLKSHDSLGTLASSTAEEQVQEFEKRAGRQLLVALHEATSGRPFEDILIDEYRQISPSQAQSIYLTICILHRLGVAVRAGIIFRSHQVPFTDFKERFFEPLEQVVAVRQHRPTGDYMYTSRHPEIAQVVFDRILRDPQERFNEYIRVLSSLNISYESDNDAFRQLTRAYHVKSLFPDYEAAREIYRVAGIVAPEDPYRVHQQGIYEMQRPNGNLDRAYELFKEVQARMPQYRPVKHSLAELARMKALAAGSPFMRARLRAEAEELASELLQGGGSREYPRHTLIKIAMDELFEVAGSTGASDVDIEKAVDKVESLLGRGLQESPDDSAMLASEADFRHFLNDDSRVLEALERAFKVNRRQVRIALRLAKLYSFRGEKARAVEVLNEALESNRGDQRLHFQLAIEMMSDARYSSETVIYHLKRSHTPGDQNYVARFWYARYLHKRADEGDLDEARQIFRELRRAPVPKDQRTRIRDDILDGADRKRFSGVIVRLDANFGFIRNDINGQEIFVHSDQVDETAWRSIGLGTRVAYSIGFNFGGPTATVVERS